MEVAAFLACAPLCKSSAVVARMIDPDIKALQDRPCAHGHPTTLE
jgi:hypothetical protein